MNLGNRGTCGKKLVIIDIGSKKNCPRGGTQIAGQNGLVYSNIVVIGINNRAAT